MTLDNANLVMNAGAFFEFEQDIKEQVVLPPSDLTDLEDKVKFVIANNEVTDEVQNLFSNAYTEWDYQLMLLSLVVM